MRTFASEWRVPRHRLSLARQSHRASVPGAFTQVNRKNRAIRRRTHKESICLTNLVGAAYRSRSGRYADCGIDPGGTRVSGDAGNAEGWVHQGRENHGDDHQSAVCFAEWISVIPRSMALHQGLHFRLRPLKSLLARGCVVVALCLSMTAFLAKAPAQAEWYVIAETGVVLPGSLSNVTLNSSTVAGGVNQARIADVGLEKGSPLYGAKVGYFFPRREWFGIETEAYSTQLNVTQQTVVGGVPGKVFADTMPGSHFQLTTWAVNAIVRSPSLVAELEPYGGIGPALFFSTSDKTFTSIGINLIAGARYFVTPRMALFGEFKYNRATIHTESLQGDYSAQLFVFGISIHFDRPLASSSGK
jgi:opacity protein-like surface antigen